MFLVNDWSTFKFSMNYCGILRIMQHCYMTKWSKSSIIPNKSTREVSFESYACHICPYLTFICICFRYLKKLSELTARSWLRNLIINPVLSFLQKNECIQHECMESYKLEDNMLFCYTVIFRSIWSVGVK